MRALLAALLGLTLLAAAAGQHVHAPSSATDDCVVCVLRHADVPRCDAPDVVPAVRDAGEVVSAPGLPPVTGAPLGAIPGQSPPAPA